MVLLSQIEELWKEYEKIGGIFNEEAIERRIEEIEREAAREDFWSDRRRAEELMKELSLLKDRLSKLRDIGDRIAYLKEIHELADEEPDLAEEVTKEYDLLKQELEDFQLQLLFNNEEDYQNAILEIHPGAGGTESQDWAEMLLKMYLRWAERRGYRVSVLDYQRGETAGIKSATLLIQGPYAYGYLKGEKGVHRLVRISPFDANRRRHTSFAAVGVLPEMKDVEVEIKPEDLKIETFRSSGAGGQHVNKTESAVRITHVPTGIVVVMRSERSQHQNRENAMRVLKARLYDYYRRRQEEKLKELAGPKSSIEWGHQIRSYVLYPYKLVKDHRTGYQTSNAEAVLDGELDEFIKSYLFWKSEN
ncbi:MAG: peptide chain release factor 2 [Thermotogae bacterium]|nr:peptide chain release factor 2 [Thermotogota bacterium]